MDAIKRNADAVGLPIGEERFVCFSPSGAEIMAREVAGKTVRYYSGVYRDGRFNPRLHLRMLDNDGVTLLQVVQAAHARQRRRQKSALQRLTVRSPSDTTHPA